MKRYAHFTYHLTGSFPADERFSSSQQVHRSSLSVALNYIEGYCRRRDRVQLNFFETAYGSLGETRFLYEFAAERHWLSNGDFEKGEELANEIGAMLWSEIMRLEKKIGRE